MIISFDKALFLPPNILQKASKAVCRDANVPFILLAKVGWGCCLHQFPPPPSLSKSVILGAAGSKASIRSGTHWAAVISPRAMQWFYHHEAAHPLSSPCARLSSCCALGYQDKLFSGATGSRCLLSSVGFQVLATLPPRNAFGRPVFSRDRWNNFKTHWLDFHQIDVSAVKLLNISLLVTNTLVLH